MVSMTKLGKMGLLALTAVFFLWTDAAFAAPKIGSVAPSFELKSTEGNMVNSKDLKGKVVVIFFGTRTVSDYVNEIHLDFEKRFKGKDVAIFTVAINPPSFFTDGMLKLASKTPMLIDRGGKMSHTFDVADEDGEPYTDLTVILIDKDWKIRDVQEDEVPDGYYKKIEALLK